MMKGPDTQPARIRQQTPILRATQVHSTAMDPQQTIIPSTRSSDLSGTPPIIQRHKENAKGITSQTYQSLLELQRLHQRPMALARRVSIRQKATNHPTPSPPESPARPASWTKQAKGISDMTAGWTMSTLWSRTSRTSSQAAELPF